MILFKGRILTGTNALMCLHIWIIRFLFRDRGLTNSMGDWYGED
jgi:hypothetical protein